jgi:hypothetical protein
VWKIVLERTAKQFREHPDMWCKGCFGTLQNIVARREIGLLRQVLSEGKMTACLDQMIIAQSLIVAGAHGFEYVADKARSEICKHHRLPKDAVIEFNDGEDCNCARDAAAFVEAVLLEPVAPETAPESVLEDA